MPAEMADPMEQMLQEKIALSYEPRILDIDRHRRAMLKIYVGETFVFDSRAKLGDAATRREIAMKATQEVAVLKDVNVDQLAEDIRAAYADYENKNGNGGKPGGPANGVDAAKVDDQWKVADDRPSTLAAHYLAMHADTPVHRWRDDWYRWAPEAGCYNVLSVEALKADVFNHIDRCFTPGAIPGKLFRLEGNRNTVADAMEALIAQPTVLIPDDTEAPCWIGDAGDNPVDLLAFPNGLLNLRTQVFHEPTSRLFVTSAVSFAYDPQAPAPTHWLRFLDEVFPNDSTSQDLLSEVFGYLVTHDTSLQSLFMWLGQPGTGKGTTIRVLTAMVGDKNVAQPGLGDLGGQFGLQHLIGRRIACITDARNGTRTDVGRTVENLLRLSGEDNVTVDRKNRLAWHGRLRTRFVLVSNSAPSLPDNAAALSRRLVLLRFNGNFGDKPDRSVEPQLMAELPGILLWSLKGLARLSQRGHFLMAEAAKAELVEVTEMFSPMRSFIAECCTVGKDQRVKVQEISDAYNGWAARTHHGILSPERFGTELHGCVTVTPTRPTIDGKRVRFFKGIGLNHEGEIHAAAARSVIKVRDPVMSAGEQASAVMGRLRYGT